MLTLIMAMCLNQRHPVYLQYLNGYDWILEINNRLQKLNFVI